MARIAEAQREGWSGEVEGLSISLAGAQDKLDQIDRRSGRRNHTVTGSSLPAASIQTTPNNT
jgi:hypothetical protein